MEEENTQLPLHIMSSAVIMWWVKRPGEKQYTAPRALTVPGRLGLEWAAKVLAGNFGVVDCGGLRGSIKVYRNAWAWREAPNKCERQSLLSTCTATASVCRLLSVPTRAASFAHAARSLPPSNHNGMLFTVVEMPSPVAAAWLTGADHGEVGGIKFID